MKILWRLLACVILIGLLIFGGYQFMVYRVQSDVRYQAGFHLEELRKNGSLPGFSSEDKCTITLYKPLAMIMHTGIKYPFELNVLARKNKSRHAVYYYRLLKTAPDVEWKLIGACKGINVKGKHGTMYAPVFVFSDPEGKTRKVFSSVSSFPPVGAVGDKIAILYDPENPKRTAENTFFSVWGISAILGGCGAFYLILFWLVWLFTKRKISTLNIG